MSDYTDELEENNSPTGIERAITMAGGQALLAERMGRTQQAVSLWLDQGYVPSHMIPGVLNAVDPDGDCLRPRDLMDPFIKNLIDNALDY